MGKILRQMLCTLLAVRVGKMSLAKFDWQNENVKISLKKCDWQILIDKILLANYIGKISLVKYDWRIVIGKT